MKLVRFSSLRNNILKYGIIKKNIITPILNSIYDNNFNLDTENQLDLKDCRLHLPIIPSKIVGVAQNFKKRNIKNEPLFFLKSSNSLVLQDKKINMDGRMTVYESVKRKKLIIYDLINKYDISSSSIQQMLLSDNIKGAKKFLSPKVLDFILSKGLYR